MSMILTLTPTISHELTPRAHWWLRWGLVCGLTAALVTLGARWDACLLAALGGALWLGTRLEARVGEDGLVLTRTLAFIRLARVRLPVEELRRIETSWQETGGLGEALWLGAYPWLGARLHDWLAPGWRPARHIWVRRHDGRRQLVWHGNRRRCFERNVATLQAQLLLPVTVVE